ncbi:hypothetical protein [Planktothrix paucivesiculata]|uniref:Uncharacterized protein n=1 Tax=Planktothrix paucivesiculata PCC 9631 TaxID=671071 RepID=A0A7Z9BWH6_9CYAN|nr:hypothetical protein [Planktothrix paucivesiculata]VXD23580.1 hypothetical protein PL9631_740044 [Planktothrix paucivesiculata PCC 9631]
MNNQPRNQPHSNRENPDPVRDESIRQNERAKVNNETAWGTLIGIGVAVLLSLGIGSLVWPTLFKPDASKAPTVGPGQSESNPPKTQAPGRDTVIIEKNRTQVVPVPVQVPEPKPNVNVTVPPVAPQPAPNVNVTVPPVAPQPAPDVNVTVPSAAPQPAPNVNVTVPPAAPEAEPTKDEVLPETNSSPTSEPSPPASGDTEN